eukprot:jgi/Botrbrau1/17116/Bobra.0157s0018.1
MSKKQGAGRLPAYKTQGAGRLHAETATMLLPLLVLNSVNCQAFSRPQSFLSLKPTQNAVSGSDLTMGKQAQADSPLGAPSAYPQGSVHSQGLPKESTPRYQTLALGQAPSESDCLMAGAGQLATSPTAFDPAIITDFHILPLGQTPYQGNGSSGQNLRHRIAQAALSAVTDFQTLTRPVSGGEASSIASGGSGSPEGAEGATSSPTVGPDWQVSRGTAVREFLRQEAASRNGTSEIQQYSEQMGANGNMFGSGLLTVKGADGTVLRQAAFSAPLVPRARLQVLLDYTKLHAAATAFTEEGFYQKLEERNARGLVDRVKLINVNVSSTPNALDLSEVVTFLSDCWGLLPTKTWAFAVTFPNEPRTAGFFFHATEMNTTATWVTDMCFRPVPLDTAGGPPCPPHRNRPCMVARGFQLAFQSVRDQLLPLWQSISTADYPAAPTKVICGGLSLGGAIANLCSVFMKGLFPTAQHYVYTTGNPLVGNAAFKQFYQEGLAGSNIGTNGFDPVPTVPPPIVTGFKHLADAFWVVPTSLRDSQSTRAFAVQRPKWGLYLNVLDHFAASYIDGITAALANAPP